MIRQRGLRPEEIIDLAAYPIADSDDPARRDLVERLRSELDRKQHCVLPGFMRRGAREPAIADAMAG